MRIRKPLHRNASTVVRVVNVAPEETTAISVGVLKRKGWSSDGNKASVDSVSTLSRQASPMRPGSNLSVDQLWHEELATRHYVRRSSNVALRDKMDGEDEEIKQEEAMSDDTKLPSASKLNPEENPSTAPEGSLLHTLYLQLLAAGSEGITLRDLFTSFKKQTALPSFGSSWKEQVRSHLKNNPHCDERKGHYLLCTQLRQPLKRSPAAMKRPGYMGVSPRTTSGRPVRTTFKSPAVQQPSSLSKENQHEGVQTRRKAYEKTIEKVLSESAKEFEKMQLMANSPGSSSGGPPDAVTIGQPTDYSPVSRKRKSSFSDNEELLEGCKTIRGSLQAMQAKIVAETGVQLGVPCARKDDARKWRCPLMAMEGHTLCDHHKSLQLRKKIRKQEEYNKKTTKRRGEEDSTKLNKRRLKAEIMCSPEMEVNEGGAHVVEAVVDLQDQLELVSLNAEAVTEDDATIEEAESEVLINQTVHTDGSLSPDGRNVHYEKAIPGSLKALQAKIVAESGVQSGVRCARKDGSNDSARKWQCPLNAMDGHTLCEHHNFLKERKRARYAAAKQIKKKAGAGRRGDNNLPECHTDFDELPPRPSKSSEKDATLRTSGEKVDHIESTDTDDNVEPAKGNAKDDDDSNAEPLPPKAAPKRWYVAAKKTAAGSVLTKQKSQDRETSPLIRQPTIPPLPAMYGVRRKVVKNRSLLSL